MEVITKEVEKREIVKKVEKGNTLEGKGTNNRENIPGDFKVKKEKVTRDRPIKSILKAITWRIIASLTTFILAYLFFYSDPLAAQKATGIALAEAIIKMFLYFFHERAWESLRWGRMMVIIRRGTRKSKRSMQRIILRKP